MTSMPRHQKSRPAHCCKASVRYDGAAALKSSPLMVFGVWCSLLRVCCVEGRRVSTRMTLSLKQNGLLLSPRRLRAVAIRRIGAPDRHPSSPLRRIHVCVWEATQFMFHASKILLVETVELISAVLVHAVVSGANVAGRGVRLRVRAWCNQG